MAGTAWQAWWQELEAESSHLELRAEQASWKWQEAINLKTHPQRPTSSIKAVPPTPSQNSTTDWEPRVQIPETTGHFSSKPPQPVLMVCPSCLFLPGWGLRTFRPWNSPYISPCVRLGFLLGKLALRLSGRAECRRTCNSVCSSEVNNL